MLEWSLINTHIFSIRPSTAFCIRNVRLLFSTIFRGHFKLGNHQQKARKCEKWARNVLWKDACLQSESWKGKAECGFVSMSGELVSPGLLKHFDAPACPWVTRKASQGLFWGVTDTQWQWLNPPLQNLQKMTTNHVSTSRDGSKLGKTLEITYLDWYS